MSAIRDSNNLLYGRRALGDHRLGRAPGPHRPAELPDPRRARIPLRRAGRLGLSDPITGRRPGPAPRGLLLKAAVVIPDVIISTLLWLVLLAALPPAIGFGITIAWLTVASVLAAGLCEDAAVRLIYRARRPTVKESPRLALAWRLAIHRLDADGVRLRIVTHGPPVGTAGRRHILLHRDLLDAYRANEVTARDVAALITHGISRLHRGHTRFDMLWTFWTIPLDFTRGLAHAIGRSLAWIPLLQFAWRTRLLVGGIAVVLEAQAGRWPSPIIIASFATLSYLMPQYRRTWQRHLAQP